MKNYNDSKLDKVNLINRYVELRVESNYLEQEYGIRSDEYQANQEKVSAMGCFFVNGGLTDETDGYIDYLVRYSANKLLKLEEQDDINTPVEENDLRADINALIETRNFIQIEASIRKEQKTKEKINKLFIK